MFNIRKNLSSEKRFPGWFVKALERNKILTIEDMKSYIQVNGIHLEINQEFGVQYFPTIFSLGTDTKVQEDLLLFLEENGFNWRKYVKCSYPGNTRKLNNCLAFVLFQYPLTLDPSYEGKANFSGAHLAKIKTVFPDFNQINQNEITEVIGLYPSQRDAEIFDSRQALKLNITKIEKTNQSVTITYKVAGVYEATTGEIKTWIRWILREEKIWDDEKSYLPSACFLNSSQVNKLFSLTSPNVEMLKANAKNSNDEYEENVSSDNREKMGENCSGCEKAILPNEVVWNVVVQKAKFNYAISEVDVMDESLIFTFCKKCAAKRDLENLPEPNLK